jgi:hypothetical protein
MNNKTREYLQRIINVCYGTQFILELKSLTSYEDTMMGDSIKGIYALDVLYVRSKHKWSHLDPCFYILFHSKGCLKDDIYVNPELGTKRFNKFLIYIRDQKFYEHDYAVSETEHMVIIKIPDRFRHAYEMFFKNRYSEMYTLDDLEYLNFTNLLKFETGTVISLTYAVLTRNKEYGRMKVLKELENNFGVTAIPEDLTEYDIPWLIRHEIYHHECMTDEEKELLKKLRS